MTGRVDTRAEDEGRGRCASRLVGAWEREGLTDSRQVKVFTGAHFVWVVCDRQTGVALSVGGGTYHFDGAALTEKYEYSNAPHLVGSELTVAVLFHDDDT
jgi:hypothetical protein